MSNIRVNYSGMISFVIGLSAVFFGLLYSLMVTRTLSSEEYGTVALILNIVNYFLVSELIVSYWSTRQIARGTNLGKSSILSSLALSIVVVPIFLVYAFFVSEGSNTSFEIMMVGVILLPVQFLSQTINGINLAHKPHAISYGILIFETIRIPFVFVFVVNFQMGILGVIVSLFIPLVVKVLVQTYFALPKIKDSFDYSTIKWWFKYSWVPLFVKLQNYIQMADVALYSILVGSVIGVAYYSVSLTVAVIVGHSGVISQALYPKILAEKSFEGIKENFNTVLYFGILLVGIAMIFSKPALFALNPIYQGAWIVVIIISIKIFFQIMRQIPSSIISGTEQIDLEKDSMTFKKLIKSNLFYVPKLLAISNCLYIVTFIVLLVQLEPTVQDELDLVIYWTVLGLFFEIPLSIYFWIYSRKYSRFEFPWKNLVKYVLATLGVLVFYLVSSESIITYEKSIYKFLPSVILELSICIALYVGITYLISKDTRILFKSILKELRQFV